MYVMIDDLRDIEDFVSSDEETKVIRTFQEGMKFVENEDLRDLYLLMDNDLGDDRPGLEGYDILSAAIDAGNYPKGVVLVTSNPVARKRMGDMLVLNGYEFICGMYHRIEGV